MMGDATSVDPRTAASAHAPDTPPPPTQEVTLADDTEEIYSSATTNNKRPEEYDFSAIQRSRIPRFPHYLIGMGGADRRYVLPSVVAIGPYHHGLPHLHETEEFKKASANKFCAHFGISYEKVLQRILTVATDARRCYSSSVVAGLSDEEFVAMMVVDGCFLLWFMMLGMGNMDEPLMVSFLQSCGPSFIRDIFMLENQIPWMVLKTLMDLTGLEVMGPLHFVMWVAEDFSSGPPETKRNIISRIFERIHETRKSCTDDNDMKLDYEPPHLLGLLWFVLRSNRMHPQNSGESELNHHPVRKSRPISAVELKQAGFKLTASTGWFAYMKCQKKKLPFSGELSLSPLFLSENRACGLINMAALESVLATNPESWDMDVYVVNSYLSLLAMLMVREDDVHQLRKSGILISSFSDAQTLDLFKCLSLHLRPGNEFFSTLDEIEWCLRNRKVSIAIRKFVSNNYKAIAAVLSIAGALIGVLKALYSLKTH